MALVPRRLGGTTWLAAAVALLLPALAWLQFDWANQLAAADRDRRERTLRSAASQFVASVDAEISRLGASLQLDGAMVERRDWEAYALRYDAALDGGAEALVEGVWFAEIDEKDSASRRVTLHAWNASTRTFDRVAWPPSFAPLEQRLLAQPPRGPRDGRASPREIFGASEAVGDERTIVMPVVRVQVPNRTEPAGERFRTDVQLRGYTIVRLDTDVLARERLPELVNEHFPVSSDYRVAVVAVQGERVIFESSPGAAADTAATPDLSTTFMQPRVSPMVVLAQIDPSTRGARTSILAPPPPPPPPPPSASLDGTGETRQQVVIEMRDRDGERTVRTRSFSHGHGHWTLRVKHAAGSLEAAVAGARRRNLMLSGGVLALLGVAVGLIAVSARRAQGLARQQMEFVAAVSHELRTPVAVINSAAGNLADGVVADAAKVRRYGETIQSEARRLGETVERVLQLAGLGSGRRLPMTPLAAADIVREAVGRSADDASRAGVRVETAIAPHVPDVLGDAGALSAAVQNLVGNAVKYAGDDRWVRVTVSGVASPRREVRIAVEDHGAGLDADERGLVFEPFFRGRHAVANQIQGSGLGLSLVRRIAEAHGGRVELDSEPGRGSTFTICLPAAPDAPIAHRQAAAPAPTASSPSAG